MSAGSDRQFNNSKALELQKTKRDLAASILREDNSLIRNLRRDDQKLLLLLCGDGRGLIPLRLRPGSTMAEPIICPLWVNKDGAFRSRSYHAWDRPCRLCGRKVVLRDAI